MEIITNTCDFYLEKQTAVAIGKFDGIHIGHQRLLQEIIDQKKNGLLACVFTFDMTPPLFFGHSDGRVLTTKEEKRMLLERMGIDVLIEFPLTAESAAMEPEDFFKTILLEQMNTAFIAAGTDVSFGYMGRGNAKLLQEMGNDYDILVKMIEKIQLDGLEISSTYGRTLLEQGDMEILRQVMGMPYFILGNVVHGKEIGRKIGFPTINLLPSTQKLLPPFGVYYAHVKFKGEEYKGICNIGYKPTVTEEKVCGIETHLFDFHGDLYGAQVELYLEHFHRPEQKFESLEDLQQQLAVDIAAGINYFNLH